MLQKKPMHIKVSVGPGKFDGSFIQQDQNWNSDTFSLQANMLLDL